MNIDFINQAAGNKKRYINSEVYFGSHRRLFYYYFVFHFVKITDISREFSGKVRSINQRWLRHSLSIAWIIVDLIFPLTINYNLV